MDKSIQIQQFAETMRLKNYAERTIQDYTLNVKDFFKYLTEEEYLKNVDDIRPDHIRSYHLHLQERVFHNKVMTQKSIRTKMGSVKAFFKLMNESGLIRNNLESCIILPRLKVNPPKNLPSVKEIIEYLDSVVPNNPITSRDRTILELLYASGIRNAELRKLKINNLDLNEQKLFIDGKGGTNRLVSIGEWLIPFFTKYLSDSRLHFAHNGTDLLFPSKNGRTITQANLRDLVRKYAVRMGTSKRITPHTFRHCCATHLLKGGCDIRFVQQHLGHIDIKSTILYTHLLTDDLKDAHSKYHPRQRNNDDDEQGVVTRV
jgi:integrase/recombinase XerD